MSDQPTTEQCIRCGNSVDINKSIAVRLNNKDLPNGPGDKWGFQHQDCTTAEDKAELDGSKYFGKGWNN
jgi:hypothetical protein